ncbi:MAG: PSP1 domain-containing protein [Fastidiosipilaceae bacterium]|jgi:cell fate regulator YaaT (PSP1 superfamily)|nr:stage 0 sporulation family protein [Clostridiaceae bacterium]
MPNIVGIRFHDVGKAYDFETNGLTIRRGDPVIVETVQGIELGFAANDSHDISLDKVEKKLKPVLRIATDSDLEQYNQNLEKEREAFFICRDKIEEHGLDMNLVGVDFTFDARKIIFYFTSDGRIDFRRLVKDLAQIFHVRIELRQIGVRDEARMIGGVGICGREFCCSSFLKNFVPVSIKMAKGQGLSMNPSKISGCCGRLMCCLMYEQDAYSSARRGLPKLKSIIDTPEGRGKVMGVETLKEQVKVILEDDPEREVRVYTKLDLGIKPQETMAERLGEDESEWQDLSFDDDDILLELEDDTIDLDAIFEDWDMPDEGMDRDLPDDRQRDVKDHRSDARSDKKKTTQRLGRPAEKDFVPHPVKQKKTRSSRSNRRFKSNSKDKSEQKSREAGDNANNKRRSKKRRSSRYKKKSKKSGPTTGFRPVEKKRD